MKNDVVINLYAFKKSICWCFLINKCAKRRGNYTEKIVKSDIPKLRIFAKKVGISCDAWKPLILLDDFGFKFLKNRWRELKLIDFFNFNEFFGVKKLAKAIPPNWLFLWKFLGVLSLMLKTLIFPNDFDFKFLKNRWRE